MCRSQTLCNANLFKIAFLNRFIWKKIIIIRTRIIKILIEIIIVYDFTCKIGRYKNNV